MSRPSSYDLLTVIHQEVKDLRLEIKGELKTVQEDRNADIKRIASLEKFQYNLMGKIGVGVLVVGAVVSGLMTIIISWISGKIK